VSAASDSVGQPWGWDGPLNEGLRFLFAVKGCCLQAPIGKERDDQVGVTGRWRVVDHVDPCQLCPPVLPSWNTAVIVSRRRIGSRDCLLWDRSHTRLGNSGPARPMELSSTTMAIAQSPACARSSLSSTASRSTVSVLASFHQAPASIGQTDGIGRARNTAFVRVRPVTSHRGKCRSMLPMFWRTPRSSGSNCRKLASGSRICSMLL
jgi:hypothetical protein